MDFTENQLLRYARHIVLPEVGGVGQAKLLESRVLVIGAGGLGDPIVTGLALNDMGLILQGAVPAAMLALLTELLFEGVEHAVLPGHLRRKNS